MVEKRETETQASRETLVLPLPMITRDNPVRFAKQSIVMNGRRTVRRRAVTSVSK